MNKSLENDEGSHQDPGVESVNKNTSALNKNSSKVNTNARAKAGSNLNKQSVLNQSLPQEDEGYSDDEEHV